MAAALSLEHVQNATEQSFGEWSTIHASVLKLIFCPDWALESPLPKKHVVKYFAEFRNFKQKKIFWKFYKKKKKWFRDFNLSWNKIEHCASNFIIFAEARDKFWNLVHFLETRDTYFASAVCSFYYLLNQAILRSVPYSQKNKLLKSLKKLHKSFINENFLYF